MSSRRGRQLEHTANTAPFLKLPREIRDLIYQYAFDSTPSLLRLSPSIPWSDSSGDRELGYFAVYCPSLFLACHQIYHESRRFYYSGATIEVTPDREVFKEVSKRPARHYVSRIAILLRCSGIKASMSDPPAAMVHKFLHTFKNVTSVVLILSHGLTGPGVPIPRKTLWHDLGTFIHDARWSEMIRKVCVEPGRNCISPSTSEMRADMSRAFRPIWRLPSLSELDIHLSTRLKDHSSGRGQAYVDTPQRRRLFDILYSRETYDVEPYLACIAPLFPQVNRIRLWRVRQRGTSRIAALPSRASYYLEPMKQSQLLAPFGGRAWPSSPLTLREGLRDAARAPDTSLGFQ